jgi:hypothetical protein
MPIVGTAVTLVGLKSKSFNGRHGVVICGKTTNGRVPVTVDGETAPKSFAETNLDPAAVEVPGDCPICMLETDDAVVDKHMPGLCPVCGQTFCGSCFVELVRRCEHKCPTCRQPMQLLGKEREKLTAMTQREKGKTVAQFQLGLLELRADNLAGAAVWFTLSAWRGNPVAMFNLAQFYMRVRRIDEGIRWFERASSRAYVRAQHALGHIYRLGLHNAAVPDTAKSETWFETAKANGCEMSARYLASSK